MTHLSVDADRCTGHGRCYALAPEVFDADDLGHCLIRVADPTGALAQQAANAAQNCPEEAITLSD
jgi:ferredoxin